MPTVRDLEARADAQPELDALNAQTRDDVLTGDVKSAVAGLGLGSSSTQVTNDANTFIPLHHAFDGRTVSVPLYMLNQMNSLLSHRFGHGNDIPAEYRGKRVWYSNPDDVTRPETASILCALSIEQPEEMQAAMREAGLNPDCRKPAQFRTQFEADYHFERKHPRRWQAYQRYLEAKRSTASTDQIAALVDAFLTAAKEK